MEFNNLFDDINEKVQDFLDIIDLFLWRIYKIRILSYCLF